MKGRFGAEQVFKSGQSIQAGEDFADRLVVQAATSDIMLVLIGPGWLAAPAPDGSRKIDAADDWVRREIATALHNRRHVVPLLLGDDVMLPGADELPADIAQLARSQFVRLYRSSADFGLNKIAERLLELVPGLAPDEAPGSVGDPAATPAGSGLGSGPGPGTGPVDIRGGKGPTTTIVGGSGELSAATGKHAIAVTTGDGGVVNIVNRARRFAAAHPLIATLVVVGTLSGTTFGTYQIAAASQGPSTGAGLSQPSNLNGAGRTSGGTSGASGPASATGPAQPTAAGDPTPVPCPSLDQMTQATGLPIDAIADRQSPPTFCSYVHLDQRKNPEYVVNIYQPPGHLGAAGNWTLAQYRAELDHGDLTEQPALGNGAFSGLQPGTACMVWFVPPGHQLVVEAQTIEYLADQRTDVCTPAVHAAALVAGVLPPI
ncbi:hypothetical protein GCM10009839_54100 [Catenulispora yoronensis]|uniref:TIR domain-containing protein n=1 Tax=Catenulispora yoronensis TaxID=450799 RepID=A0ABP5GGH8_9ACTN